MVFSGSDSSLEDRGRVRYLAMVTQLAGDAEPEGFIAYNWWYFGKVKVLSVLDWDEEVPKIDGVDGGRLTLLELSEAYSAERLGESFGRWRRSRKQIEGSRIQKWKDRRFKAWKSIFEIPEVVAELKIVVVERRDSSFSQDLIQVKLSSIYLSSLAQEFLMIEREES